MLTYADVHSPHGRLLFGSYALYDALFHVQTNLTINVIVMFKHLQVKTKSFPSDVKVK